MLQHSPTAALADDFTLMPPDFTMFDVTSSPTAILAGQPQQKRRPFPCGFPFAGSAPRVEQGLQKPVRKTGAEAKDESSKNRQVAVRGGEHDRR